MISPIESVGIFEEGGVISFGADMSADSGGEGSVGCFSLFRRVTFEGHDALGEFREGESTPCVDENL